MKGKLYLVPAPLDFGCSDALQTPIANALPASTLQTAAAITHWICENAKSTRAVLKRVSAHYPLACAIQDMTITELPREAHKKGDHTPAIGAASSLTATSASIPTSIPASIAAQKSMLQAALQGCDVGLMSEAGMPAIADPGSSIVRAAHSLGIEVVPLIGPVSLLLALAASGLNGQNFAFNGYLPQDSTARKAQIQHFERHALKTGQSQIFIETPYRNAALLADLVTTLQATSRLACSVGLTLSNSQTVSQTVANWQADKTIGQRLLGNKLPAIFSFGA